MVSLGPVLPSTSGLGHCQVGPPSLPTPDRVGAVAQGPAQVWPEPALPVATQGAGPSGKGSCGPASHVGRVQALQEALGAAWPQLAGIWVCVVCALSVRDGRGTSSVTLCVTCAGWVTCVSSRCLCTGLCECFSVGMHMGGGVSPSPCEAHL
jgi:hypothetical protein